MMLTTKVISGAALFSAASLLAAGTAYAEEKTYDLSDFDGVSVSAGNDAEITVGGNFSVRAEGDADAIDSLKIEVRDGALDIGRKRGNFSWRKSGSATVYVTLPALNELEVSSGSEASASGVKANGFSVDGSSGASITVSGECDSISADVSSGAKIDAEKLKCKSANADASSGGSLRVFASDSLIADASSGGSVKVYGGPKNTNVDKSSGGSVKIVN